MTCTTAGAFARWTALHRAANNGHAEVAKLLLEAGAEVNIDNDDGESPLLRAARRGRLNLVKLLCSYGAKRRGNEGAAAGAAALQGNHPGHNAVVAWLLDTADLITALHYIVPPNDLVPPPRARALLRAGADLNAARGANGSTPVHLARELEAEGNAPDGSTARLILRAAGPWTRETHSLFPDKRRAEACSLVFSICHIHARRCVGTGFPEMQDFAALVLKYAITR
jgi:hypothetical protein